MKPTAAESENRDRLAMRFMTRLATIISCLGALATLVAFGARWSSLCELASHWPVQIAVATGLACTILRLTRAWTFAMLAGVVAVVNMAYVVPIFLPQLHGPVGGPTCRAVSANVLKSNRDTQRFLDFIHAAAPDFFLVMEIDTSWREQLESLDEAFPFSVIRPRADNFGIGLMSRHPILSHRVESLDDSGIPTIIATIDFQGRPLNVVGTHPLPPVGPGNAALRNQHLHTLGELVSELPRPVVVLGDLNATPWSPCFGELLRRSGLSDSRQGFGVLATWPNRPWAMRIPIDHALLSQDLIVTERLVGPDIGSDHRPIVVAFAGEDG